MRFSCFGLDGDIINKPIYPKDENEMGLLLGRRSKTPLSVGFDIDGYDENGFNKRGYNRQGFDKDGFDEYGWNKDRINKLTGTKYDSKGLDWYGYDKDGFSRSGWNKKGINKNTGTKFNEQGYDYHGYDKDGYDRNGRNKEGINKKTGTLYDENGLDTGLFDIDGWDKYKIHNKFTGTKFGKDGFNKEGLNKYNFDRNGLWWGKDKYNRKGFDINGYNKYTKSKFDKDGYNLEGYDKNGYDEYGFDKNLIHKVTGTKFDEEGIDRKGYRKGPEDYDDFRFDVLLAGYFLHGLGTFQTFYVSWTIPTGEIKAFHIYEDYGLGLSKLTNFGVVHNPYNNKDLLDKLKIFNSDCFSGLRDGKMPETNHHTGYIININPILFQYRDNDDIIFKLEETKNGYIISYKIRKMWKENNSKPFSNRNGFVNMCGYNGVTDLCVFRNDIFLLDINTKNGFIEEEILKTLDSIADYVKKIIKKETGKEPSNGTWILPSVYRSEY